MFKCRKEKNPFIYHFITGTAIIVFWRGLWGLLDLYLFPGSKELSYIASVIVGLAILYLNDFSISELGGGNFRGGRLYKIICPCLVFSKYCYSI